MKRSELYIGRTVKVNGRLAKLASATAHGGPWMLVYADGERGHAPATDMEKTEEKLRWKDIPDETEQGAA